MSGDFDLDKREKCGISITNGNHAPICDLPKMPVRVGGVTIHGGYVVDDDVLRARPPTRFTTGDS
jgi:hypothetical protein